MNQPSTDNFDQAKSQKLQEAIRKEIVINKNPLSFAHFMELAFSQDGSYKKLITARKFHSKGHFAKIYEISSLYTKCMAAQCHQILQHCQGQILEIGAGSGKFTRDLLFELEEYGQPPQNYFILNIDLQSKKAQQEFLKDNYADLFTRIIWLDELPSQFTGIIIFNEIINTMPTHCFAVEPDGVKERCVTWKNNQFTWEFIKPKNDLLAKLDALQYRYHFPLGYESQINLLLPELIIILGRSLKKGVALIIDHGYGRNELYNSDRSHDSLKCIFQNQDNTDPFINIGLQDIISDIDFTTIAESVNQAHLTLSGYTTLASFLLACGLLEIKDSTTQTMEEKVSQEQAIKLLTLPSQKGESIKVMALTKDFHSTLLGFSLHDRRSDL